MTTLSNHTPDTQNAPTGYMFLDVDGILNPFLRDLKIDGWKLVEIEGFWVWTSKPLSEWFKALIDAGIQIVWATTWIITPPGLAKLERKWGFPADLPRIDKLERNPTRLDEQSCGKRPGIIRWMNANGVNAEATPCVWVDDDLGPLDIHWAEGRGVKTVKVPAYRGLSDPEQVKLIERALGVSVETVGVVG